MLSNEGSSALWLSYCTCLPWLCQLSCGVHPKVFERFVSEASCWDSALAPLSVTLGTRSQEDPCFLVQGGIVFPFHPAPPHTRVQVFRMWEFLDQIWPFSCAACRSSSHAVITAELGWRDGEPASCLWEPLWWSSAFQWLLTFLLQPPRPCCKKKKKKKDPS